MNSELPEELIGMVRKLNGSQLHTLNHLAVERLKVIHKVRDLHALREFQIFDRVKFNHHGETMKGVICRINQKSVTVNLDNGERWIVSPHNLKKIQGEKNQIQNAIREIMKNS